MQAAANGTPIVIHHNHLTEESFSWADWYGLFHMKFGETHAHVSDGTHYWARVLNSAAVHSVHGLGQALEMDAMNAFTQSAIVANRVTNDTSADGQFFRKHIIAAAMMRRQYVEYDVGWGTKLSGKFLAVQNDLDNAIQMITARI